jgi:hypothetical protein
MNIPWASTPDDFDEIWENDAVQVPDILETMFAQQIEHMQAYAAINEEAQVPPHLWGDLENRRVQAGIREFAGYTIEELLGEAISGHLKNKPWKQTDKPVDRDAFLDEFADAWHFFIEMHVIAGITPTEVFKTYFAKSLINQHRQQTGY